MILTITKLWSVFGYSEYINFLLIWYSSFDVVKVDGNPQLQCFTIHISSIMKLEYQTEVFYNKDADNNE